MKIKVKSLDEIADVIAGQSPLSKYYNIEGDGLPFYQGKADFGDKYPIARAWCTEPTKIASANDILMSVRAPVGPVNIATEKCVIGRGLSAIRVKNQYDSLYLYYYLRNNQNLINRYATGSTFKAITQKDIKRIPVSIPESLDDQKRISKILSDCEALIQKRKDSIALLDELLKSTFLDMFGDPMRNEKGFEMMTGESYLEKLTVGVVVKPASHYVEKGVVALRSLNIKPNRIDLSDIVYFSDNSNNTILSKSILREGDVVFVRTGNTGTAAIIPKSLDGCNCIDLIITRPKDDLILPEYLTFFFNSEIGKRIVASKEVGGIHKHFNVGAMKKLAIPIPPLFLQEQFASVLKHTDSIRLKYESSLIDLENLYGSLSQRAFKGELDLSKADITDMEDMKEDQPEMEPIGEPKWDGKFQVQGYKVYLDEIIKHDYRDAPFSFDDLKESIAERGMYMPYESIKKFVFDSIDGEGSLLLQEVDKDKKQIVFRIRA